MPTNDGYTEFDIYFSDLNEDAQKRLLEAVGVSSPKEMNWDMDIVPMCSYCFYKESFYEERENDEPN